ncbi:hypothetical protein [Nocardia sp. NPDC059239]|uniref:hypothetical protein n=1 Tax=unclassified Nocardia TaxID=2637762 RepID=UPI0036901A5A
MSDVSFPARITIESEPDLDGVPILTATITPATEAAGDALPAGPRGGTGPRGRPRTAFLKMGTIANAAARPTGLGADDRGKWWHRLDTGGMDAWTGTAWEHSPGAVGVQGPTADPAVITASTVHSETITTPALKVTASGAALAIQATAPAGLQGDPGPAGSSGQLSAATDFDATTGPTHRSMFGYQAAAKRWKVAPPPGGFGPWAWYQDDFAVANLSTADSKIVAGTFRLPTLPFAWRPMVWLSGYIQCATETASYPILTGRLNTPNGVMVAYGAGIRASGPLYHVTAGPKFGDDAPKPLSPSSTYATIPAGESASLLVMVEKVGGDTTNLVWDRADASALVWALPIGA